MKILVCSDSHGNDTALDEIKIKYPNCDLYLHAGDSESDEWSISPFLSVAGNCDYRGDFPLRRIIDTPFGALLIQHHPQIPQDIVKQYNIKIFIHGHTHIRKDMTVGNMRVINPGSISFPRDRYDLSFAILDITQSSVDVTFHTLLEK